MCTQFYDNLVVVMVTNGFKRLLTPNITCSKLGFCTNPKIVPDNYVRYRSRLLHDKPVRQYARPSELPPMKFAVVADMHIDLKYSQVRERNALS